jgi:D-3-phosphoglycerate dehydrogenase
MTHGGIRGKTQVGWRILIADTLAPEAKAILEKQAEVLEADLTALEDIDALIVRGRSKVTAEVILSGLPRLKVIGRAGIGVDNIDLDMAKSNGVIVVNTPQATTVSVAEHTLALIFTLSRHIPAATASMRRGEWMKSELKGTELQGKNLGIIGLGRIGSEVAQRAAALGIQVIAFDPLLSDEEITARGAESVTFEELLAQADVISLHLPLTEETRSIIDAKALAAVKPGARLINTARGALVDESALLDALESGLLSGAALDVFTQEPPWPNPLLEHPRLISTPHISAQTAEAQVKAARDIAAEVLSALHGEPLRWRVV